MEKDTLSIAQHYYDLNKYQEAYDHLSTMSLIIDRQDHLKHHILLANLLYYLGREGDSQILTDELRSKFPDDYDALTHWISFGGVNPDRAREAYRLTQSMRLDYPDNYWFPYMMAYLGYHYRLQSKREIIESIEQALQLEKNETTLRFAYEVFAYYKQCQKAKSYLDELVEFAPGQEKTYQTLLKYLIEQKRYLEVNQLSYEAIHKFPNNDIFLDYAKLATNHLYGGYLEKLYNRSFYMGDQVIISRSSIHPWFHKLKNISVYLSVAISCAVFALGLLALILFTLFFVHYVIFTCDERNIKKQRKSRQQKKEYENKDELSDDFGVTSVLVKSTHLQYRFILLNNKGITLAEDVWCPIENLHYDDAWGTEDLKGDVTIPKTQLNTLVLTSKYLIIQTKQKKNYTIYFESLETLEFLVSQLKKQGYQYIKTKKSSRLLLMISCFFGAKACLTASVVVVFALSWQLGLLFVLMTLTNFISLFIYRMVNPSVSDIYKISE